jgi:TetR/AcrR family transcriptional regulator, regulator of cefoperazone and chloramphenicol sensitivity
MTESIASNDPPPADETRLRLLDAAEEVFAEVGFAAATTREICRRAGMKNIGAINYYFQSKERLYIEAVKHAMRTCTKGAPFPNWPPGTPPERKLRDFIHTMMARMLTIPKESSMNLMSREMTRTRPSPVTVEVVQEGIKPMADVLVSILNELVPDLPFERRVLVGFSVVGQCLYYRQNRAVGEVLFGADLVNSFGAATIADHIADLVLTGLGKPLAASREAQS